MKNTITVLTERENVQDYFSEKLDVESKIMFLFFLSELTGKQGFVGQPTKTLSAIHCEAWIAQTFVTSEHIVASWVGNTVTNWWWKTFIHIWTLCSVALETSIAFTPVASDLIRTSCIHIAFVEASAFIHIQTHRSITRKSGLTSTLIVSMCVLTKSIGVTSMTSLQTFIDVSTLSTITRKSRVTTTHKASKRILTTAICRAVWNFLVDAFIYIVASPSISWKALLTYTWEVTNCVGAGCIWTAVMSASCALVNVPTVCAITGKTGQTRTLKWSLSVLALCISMTAVCSESTFVNIVANCSISSVTIHTLTLKTSMVIDTRCHGSTVVSPLKALVYIHTVSPISMETDFAGTAESTRSVCTSGVAMTVIKLEQALVNVWKQQKNKEK